MASNLFVNLGRLFTPPPIPDVSNYSGSEYKWKLFVFRPGLFRVEAYLAAGLLVYALLFLLGSRMNKSRVNAWFISHLPFVVPQFSRNVELQADGHSDFFAFSTGRRYIASLHTIFKLRPRHDFLQIAYQTLRSNLVDLEYQPADTVELEFKLADSTNVDGFVWAIVKKDQLLKIKEERWDLTFTRTTDHAALPSTVSVMSEFADVTDTILTKTDSGIGQLFKEGGAWMPYFRSLSISDQPRSRPAQPLPASQRYKRVILSLNLPSNPEDTHAIVKAMFPFIDAVASKGLSLRPETKSKLRKVREELDVQLKADAEREKREEEEMAKEDKKAAKKRAEEERVGKLSAAEQAKWREREKKKAMRRTQAKMTRK